MDAPPLPDDPRDWPTDPFALLGVPRSVSETDLKRAYTRLIRKYKPEHAPDEFRRVREAYEAAVEMGRWYRLVASDDSDAEPPPAPLGAPSEPAPRNSEADARHETQIDPPAEPPARDPVEAAWVAAGAGDPAGAYAALVALESRSPNRADVPLRLYWLLALRPALDDNRTRHDWLAGSLARSGLNGPAVELYHRELATVPDALYGPYTDLLNLSGVSGARLLTVAGLRLDAAAAQERWAKIELDLDALARRARELNDALWLEHLANVIGRTACLQPALARRCVPLLSDLKHLELSCSETFDRIDYHQTFASLWRQTTLVPEPIRRAVAVGWGGTWREPLEAVADWASAYPLEALRKCDQAAIEAPAVLTAFARVLAAQRYESPYEPEYPPELIRGLVRARLASHLQNGYALVRGEVLQFLLAERIDPGELVSACATDIVPLVREFCEQVRADGPLHIVYRAATARR